MRAEFGKKSITLWVSEREMREYVPVLEWVESEWSLYSRIGNMYNYIHKKHVGDQVFYDLEVDSVPSGGGWDVTCWVKGDIMAQLLSAPTKEQAIFLVETAVRYFAMRNIENDWIGWTKVLSRLIPESAL